MVNGHTDPATSDTNAPHDPAPFAAESPDLAVTETPRVETIAFVASKPVWLLVGGLLGLIMAGFGWWLDNLQTRSTGMEQSVSAVQATAYAAGARLAAIEARLAAADLAFADLKGGQRETNAKLDRLLERPSLGSTPR